MKLVIAEKPSVGKSIAKVLGVKISKDGYLEGNNYIVSWCVGHLVQLFSPDDYDEKYKEWKFDILPIIPQNYKFKVSPTTAKQYKNLKELMNRRDVDEIVCATDAGREGECIFRYVYNLIGCHKPVKRLWISSVEDKAIKDGFENLRNSSEFDNMFAAGFCRERADWLVGMNFSRLFSCRYGSRLSVGRVQTPTLAMIVKRDNDVKNFVKQKYFTAELNCGEFIVSSARIDDEETAKSIVSNCNGKTATITSVDKKTEHTAPQKLYDLTTLQREANRQFGYTAQQTLDYTQSLYEGKLVTYPRTDSQYLTEDMEATALNMVSIIYSVVPEFKSNYEFEPNIKRLINNKKVSDHHAIIPTAEIANKDLCELPSGEKNILMLIMAKLILATAPDHKYERTKITVICENNTFTASGKTILENGFKGIEKQIKSHLKGNAEEESTEDKTIKLPNVYQGQTFDNVSSKLAEHWTTPPKTFTEDTLLSAMETAGNSDYDENSDVEKKGLGTPATRAGIIEVLIKRDFIERNKKNIIATEKGINLISVLPYEVTSPKLTADWETLLQGIEKGKESSTDFMNNIENYVTKVVGEYSNTATNKVLNKKNQIIGTCPNCGKNVVIFPKSFMCESGSEGCGFTIWKTITGKEISLENAKQLLQNRKTDLIKGFKSKEGKSFNAYLVLNNDNKIGFEFIKYGNTETSNTTESVGTCPKCGKKVIEYPKTYSCESGKNGCGFVLWKKISEKTITKTQAKKMLESGKTDLIKGFISKSGNSFDAHLVLDKTTFKTSFEFANK